MFLLLITGWITLRVLLLWGFFSRLKRVDRDMYRDAKKGYLKWCIVGWIFFLIAAAIVELLLLNESWLTQKISRSYWLVFSSAAAGIGVYAHLAAFMSGVMSALEKRCSGENEE